MGFNDVETTRATLEEAGYVCTTEIATVVFLAAAAPAEAQREFDTRFRVLLDAVREAVVFVNLGTGRIADANKAASEFLGVPVQELRGLVFAQEFEAGKRGELISNLTSTAIADIALSSRSSKPKRAI